MADVFNGPFVMFGARRAIAAGLTHVEQQVNSIEQAVVENPGLTFDLAKTLVESVCRAVLRDRAVFCSEDDDLPKLFKVASRSLPFLPPTASGEAEVRKSLAQTLSGLNSAIQGICELRNRCGFASHGSASPRPVIESGQALLAAEAADTIVGFIYRIHLQEHSGQTYPHMVYEASPAFNESVDETHGMIRIFDAEFRPK